MRQLVLALVAVLAITPPPAVRGSSGGAQCLSHPTGWHPPPQAARANASYCPKLHREPQRSRGAGPPVGRLAVKTDEAGVLTAGCAATLASACGGGGGPGGCDACRVESGLAAGCTPAEVRAYCRAGAPSGTAAEIVDCDIAVAGGSTASLAAAITAAEADPTLTVCYTEVTDWPGGQMTAGGVPAIDFGGFNGISENQPASFRDAMDSIPGESIPKPHKRKCTGLAQIVGQL
jgi:hypothetical protein